MRDADEAGAYDTDTLSSGARRLSLQDDIFTFIRSIFASTMAAISMGRYLDDISSCWRR